MAAWFARALNVMRFIIHAFIPKGISPHCYRRMVRSIQKHLVYDSSTETVTVRQGLLEGMVKCGPFVESDFNFSLGQYEPYVMDALCQFCRPGMTVFDIGANAGYLTLLMSRLVGYSGHVHAFEPIPENFKYLSMTLQMNGIGNVTLHQLAISDQSGEAQMNYVGVFDGFATLTDGGHEYYKGKSTDTISVKTVRLDQFCKYMGITEINLVKMDIEGAELRALAGMSQILAIRRPVVIIELWGAKNICQGMKLLGDQGYNIQVLSVWRGFVRGVKKEIQNIIGLPG